MASERRVYVVGGGLAGMTVAYALAKQGVPVTLLEASGRLGGKAGADWDPELGIHLDHGFHIFPLWYANVRHLLHELGIADRLIDTDRQYTITRSEGAGRAGRYYENFAVTSIGRALHNLLASPLRVRDTFLATYFLGDLAAETFRRAAFLDRVSVNGFFRSRFYRTEAVANFHHFLGLQASSIPGDAMSAMTFQNVAKGFMRYRSALVGILDGDLQTRFIEPFRERLERLGVKIHLRQRIEELKLSGARVADLAVTPQAGAPVPARRPLAEVIGEAPSPDDAYVFATPPEVTLRFVGADLYVSEGNGDPKIKQLAGLHHLVSEPMAALHVVFRRRLPHVPAWHAGLHHSRYALSFIDISRHWPELKHEDRTVLSVIAANFKELRSIEDEEVQKRLIVGELLDYLRYDEGGSRVIEDDDVVEVRLNSNVGAPLFLNTTSAWHFRPDGRTRLPNLFVAGDYCQSQADLTSMESAVWSGLTTAGHVLRLLGMDPRPAEPKRFEVPPRWQLLALRWGLLPFVAGLAFWNWIERLRERDRRPSAQEETA
jgi:phytoene dehydrogenase-like protein